MSSRGRAFLEDRGRIFRAVWSGASLVFTNLCAALGVVLFFVLNRTTVEGREHVPHERNTLLLSNHQTMIDSWLVGIGAFYPQSWWKPWLIPWNPAAEENFFDTPLMALFSSLWKALPIKEGRRDIKAVYRMLRALEEGTMTLFPEGTRSRDGSIGKGRPGAGLLILGSHPTVIPVTIVGMSQVLPVGSVVPRIGKRIHIRFGRPFDYSAYVDKPRSKETALELVSEIMEVLREQKREIEAGSRDD